jgi:hypothetical protein
VTLPLVPPARFPGFVWMIAVGLALPDSVERRRKQRSRLESPTPRASGQARMTHAFRGVWIALADSAS